MFEITWYANAYAKQGESRSYVTFAALANALAELANVEHDTTDKRLLPMFMPGRLISPDVTRGTESVRDHTLLVLDVDRVDPIGLDRIRGRLETDGTAAFVYASPSDPNTDGSRRVRIVAPLAAPLAPRDARFARRQLAAQLGLDPECGVRGAESPAQSFFVGRLRAAAERDTWLLDGKLLDGETILAAELPEAWRKGLAKLDSTGRSALVADPTAGPPDVQAVCAALDPFWEGPTLASNRRSTLRALGGYLARRGWGDEPIRELAETLGEFTDRGPTICADTMLEAAFQARGDDETATKTAGWSTLLGWSTEAARAIETATGRRGLARTRRVAPESASGDTPSMPADDDTPPGLAFAVGKQGAIKPTIENVEKVIDTYLPGVVRFEESAGRVLVQASPHRDDGQACDEDLGWFPVGEWTDTHTSALMRLCDRLDLNVPPSIADRAVDLVAKRDRFNAITDYANECAEKWDGVSRLDTALELIGCEPGDATRIASRSFLCALAARAIWPGCHSEIVLVLYGNEGHGKSSALRALAGSDDRFSDSTLDTKDRDAYQAMRGVWLWEWGEDLPRGKDWAQVKAFLSSRTDRYRPSYGRHSITVPRQTVFALSTNEHMVIPDERGARRFLPVTVPRKLTRAELDAWRAVCPQLVGEAVRVVREAAAAGESWWISAEDEQLAAEHRADFTADTRDPWCDTIEAWLAKRPELVEVTTRDLTNEITGAIPMPAHAAHRGTETRLGKALRTIGFVRRRARRDGQDSDRVYVYTRPEGLELAAPKASASSIASEIARRLKNKAAP